MRSCELPDQKGFNVDCRLAAGDVPDVGMNGPHACWAIDNQRAGVIDRDVLPEV